MGKYDDLCAQVRDATKARGVLLLVIDGERGPGSDNSIQCDAVSLVKMPETLDLISKDIRDYLAKTLTEAWQANAASNGRTRPVLAVDNKSPDDKADDETPANPTH